MPRPARSPEAPAGSLAARAVAVLERHEREPLDVFSLGRPKSTQEVFERYNINSKLSPLVANLLEFELANLLNESAEWGPGREWVRQDPDFPDLALKENEVIVAGVEIKAWNPLSTEITGRFRESQNRLAGRDYKLAVVAWIPEFLLFGRPQIIDIWSFDALNVAARRDAHYHKPPWYVVLEPEDTTERTRNLQQTNCAGYVFQGTPAQLEEAKHYLAERGVAEAYDPGAEYQGALKDLLGQYKYRLDTNFAKIDRIQHEDLEAFKARILATQIHGKTVSRWYSGISMGVEAIAADLLALGR